MFNKPLLKLDGGETKEDATGLNGNTKDNVIVEAGVAPSGENSKARPNPQNNSAFRKDGSPWTRKGVRSRTDLSSFCCCLLTVVFSNS